MSVRWAPAGWVAAFRLKRTGDRRSRVHRAIQRPGLRLFGFGGLRRSSAVLTEGAIPASLPPRI